MQKLNEWLGIEFPFIQGGMANIATGEFAAACSNAGALGVIASGSLRSAEELREQIRICRERTDKPFGVNLMLMNPAAPEMAQVISQELVPVVTTGAGNPATYIAAWKAAGVKVLPVVAATVLARRLVQAGADAIIAEGTESGGHVGEMTTMALVPQVVDAVEVPVIAAGGIADGRQMAAALGGNFAFTDGAKNAVLANHWYISVGSRLMDDVAVGETVELTAWRAEDGQKVEYVYSESSDDCLYFGREESDRQTAGEYAIRFRVGNFVLFVGLTVTN